MSDSLLRVLVDGAYLASALVFVGAVKRLTKLRTARSGNVWAAVAIAIAVVATLVDLGSVDYRFIAAGLLLGSAAGALLGRRARVESGLRPVALFSGSGAAAAVLIAFAGVLSPPERLESVVSAATLLAAWFGAVAVSGSAIAFARLGAAAIEPVVPTRALIGLLLLVPVAGALASTTVGSAALLPLLSGLAVAGALAGALLVLGFGKAELPAAVALNNAASAAAACAVGFAISNVALVSAGAMICAASLMHAKGLLAALNRSLPGVVFGELASKAQSGELDAEKSAYKNVRTCGVEEAAMVLEDARSIVLVPGYGLAVAQAQNAARELCAQLEKRGSRVRYAIHPFAGRMPGHMNVLLSEADVPYDKLIELETANSEFAETDVVIVIGANDVVNPAAEREPGSPIYGIPILQTYKARSVFVLKRSLRFGCEGVKNPLFEAENTTLIHGDAKKLLQALTSELKGGGMSHAA